jgi:hypothetical protein
MLSDVQRDRIKGVVLTLQIIVGALALGIVNFMLVIVIAFRPPAPQNPIGQSLLTYMAVGGAVLAVMASIFIPFLLAGPMRKSSLDAPAGLRAIGSKDEANIGPLAQMYQTLLIIKCVLIEGAAFFSLVAYIIEGQTTALATAGVLLLVLLAHFPTRSRMEAWIESELVVSEQMRQLR